MRFAQQIFSARLQNWYEKRGGMREASCLKSPGHCTTPVCTAKTPEAYQRVKASVLCAVQTARQPLHPGASSPSRREISPALWVWRGHSAWPGSEGWPRASAAWPSLNSLLPSQAERFKGGKGGKGGKIRKQLAGCFTRAQGKEGFSLKIQQVDEGASRCLSLGGRGWHFGAEC